MVRWRCIFVSGAFGRGKESSIGFAEGSKAEAAPELFKAGMALTLRCWSAEVDTGSQAGHVLEGGLTWQNLVGCMGASLSLPLHSSDEASF